MNAKTYTVTTVESQTDSDTHFEIKTLGRFLLGGVVSTDLAVTDERVATMIRALIIWGELAPDASRVKAQRR